MAIYALLNEAGSGLLKYPISLRREFPQISFRADPSDDELALFGVVRVRETAPRFDEAHDVTELAPELEADGRWYQRWAGVPNPDRLAALKEAVRDEIAEAGRRDWVARMAQLSDRYVNAMLAVDSARTAAEVRKALEDLG